jgi:predicted PurR-regulated permease PerM
MWGSIKLVFRFIVQMVVATVLFAVVAGLAYALSLGTEWLHDKGLPYYVYVVVLALSVLVFGLDVLCFGVFVIAEAIRLIREIIDEARK